MQNKIITQLKSIMSNDDINGVLKNQEVAELELQYFTPEQIAYLDLNKPLTINVDGTDCYVYLNDTKTCVYFEAIY